LILIVVGSKEGFLFQGGLLTLLIRPIYLKSITVGSKFHPGHMKRALYERIADHVTNLPPHYRLNVPQLYATTSPETRQVCPQYLGGFYYL
jgi:double stranded RNA-specific editase B